MLERALLEIKQEDLDFIERAVAGLGGYAACDPLIILDSNNEDNEIIGALEFKELEVGGCLMPSLEMLLTVILVVPACPRGAARAPLASLEVMLDAPLEVMLDSHPKDREYKLDS